MSTLKYCFFYLICLLPCLLIDRVAATSFSLARRGCNDTCGNVTIPYAFGIGAGCFLNEWYEVLCHEHQPYLNKSNVEVLRVSPEEQTITTDYSSSKPRLCGDDEISTRVARNLSGSPFFYDLNKVILIGCGTVTLRQNQRILGACTSTCSQNIRFVYRGRSYSCASILFGDYSSAGDLLYAEEELVRLPAQRVVLRWSILEEQVRNDSGYCGESEYYGGYSCACPGCSYGNPYLRNGCQGRRYYCYSFDSKSKSRIRLILLVVGGTILGIIFLVTSALVLYKKISKRRDRKLKEKNFKRHGGLLLQQQMSVDQNVVDKVNLYSAIELGKATDSFNENRVLGHGGQGTVYKGMLFDGKIVAVKRSILTNQSQVEQFINEVVLLSQINHRNVVKLLGCCLETDVPLLVYEFIPNGILYNLIHNDNDEFLMSWDMRLRIATEMAGALAYLHSAASVPIYHRDIKSSNILLDEKYKAKVSDFGISRHVTVDQTHLTTMVKGTFGYLDPEYFQSNQFTEKSDVYSFGVVLVELLTRQKPISLTHSTIEGAGLSLATRFLISMEEDKLSMMLDNQIMDTAMEKEVKGVATLAQRCLSLDGRKRPTMKEVAMELENIRMSHLPSMVQTNSRQSEDSEIELVIFSDGISSSITANDMIESSSDAYPLLSDTF